MVGSARRLEVGPGRPLLVRALLAGAVLLLLGAWRPELFAGGRLGALELLRSQPRVPLAAVGDEEVDSIWKEALDAERARSDLLLEELQDMKEALAGTRLEDEAVIARKLYEECAVKWGENEFEQLRDCNDRLQQGIRTLREAPKPPAGGSTSSGRLDGIGVVVEPLPPVEQSDEFALLAGAAHVRVSLPLGLQGLLWGSDLTPLFDDEGSRLMVFIASLPLGMRLIEAPRPPEAPQAACNLIQVEAVNRGSEAQSNGILAGDYVRAVSYMSPGEEPGLLDRMFGGQPIPLPAVMKCDGLTVDEVSAALETNMETPDGTVTLLLERPP